VDPVIIPREQHALSRQNISPEALRVLYGLKESGYVAYIAGGGVRDLLLGRVPKDFDIVTDATPNDVRRVFRNCRLIGRRFRLAHVFFGSTIIEVATFRSDQTPDDADENQTGHQVTNDAGVIVRDNIFGTPEQDARRRDFTINALFYNIRDYSLIDYEGGLEDLQKRVIRFIGDPRLRCVEDPVRMIRAVRFAAALGFSIDAETEQAIRAESGKLALANRSRLYEEVQKLFFCGAAQRAYELLRDFGLYEMLFPEVGSWLGPKAGTPQCHRISEALRQVDEWRQSKREVTPALLFSLMFGGMHEARAGELTAQGQHHGLALHSVTLEHFGGLTERVQVPKMVRYRSAEILASQPRLTADGGARAKPLATRAFFPEAVAYLEFMVRLTGDHRDALERVKDLPWTPSREHDFVPGRPRRRTGGGGRRGRRGKAFRAERGPASTPDPHEAGAQQGGPEGSEP
jgi:poly(A) polymerase